MVDTDDNETALLTPPPLYSDYSGPHDDASHAGVEAPPNKPLPPHLPHLRANSHTWASHAGATVARLGSQRAKRKWMIRPDVDAPEVGAMHRAARGVGSGARAGVRVGSRRGCRRGGAQSRRPQLEGLACGRLMGVGASGLGSPCCGDADGNCVCSPCVM